MYHYHNTSNMGEEILILFEVINCELMKNLLMVQLKSVRVCGPRYWPQVIPLVPEGTCHIFLSLVHRATLTCVLFFKDNRWWRPGDKNDPFNGGRLYIKRKVGSCSYVDDPNGCQSLLSRAMHKVFHY